MKLTVEILEGFAGVYLSQRYDNAKPTPDFHRECWAIYCSDVLAAAIAAPRNHAKSTALTHDYGLAMALFRQETYIIIVGSSEEMAIEHLNDIANELRENEDIIRDFKIKGFVTDQKTDIIVECLDGYKFRFLARGAEQKIRGRKWEGKRPGLVIGDDLEDDEQVENRDRRKKFSRWFFRACKQALRDGGKIRVHGTILHEDSLLSHLVKNKQWVSKVYKAHRSFGEFTDILWEEKFSAERLRSIRQEFINEGDGPGYSQEYLNDPLDFDNTYLKKENFLPMNDEDREIFKTNYVGVDFAISKQDTANRTSFTVGGKDTAGMLHHTDFVVGRMDTIEIVDEFFNINAKWKPAMFFVEDGVIWKAIYPILKREMHTRDIYIPFTALMPVKDKKVRARALQKRHKSGGCKYDKEHPKYADYEAELLRFTGDSEALLDDQVDSSAWLVTGSDQQSDPEDEDFYSEEEIDFLRQANEFEQGGRSAVTGY